MEEKTKRYVGIDLGKKMMEVRIIDNESGRIKKWHGYTDGIGRRQLYEHFKTGDLVAMEACSFAFVMAKEILEETAAEIIILNPSRLAIIYRSLKKTDSEDAMKLARLIQRIPQEELPLVPLPTEEEQEMRALAHERAFIVGQRTRYINRLHSIFVRHGITTLKKSSLKTAIMRMDSLDSLSDNRSLLGEAERCITMIDILEGQLIELDEKKVEMLKKNKLTIHVMSMPGVGTETALAFLAFVGDGNRFSKAGEVSNYIGLVPRVDISGDTVHYGRINKKYGCTPIRRVLIQAARALVMSKDGGELREKYLDLRERKGSGKAIVAIARRMGEILWIMVTRRTFYRDVMHERLMSKLKRYKLESCFREVKVSA